MFRKYSLTVNVQLYTNIFVLSEQILLAIGQIQLVQKKAKSFIKCTLISFGEKLAKCVWEVLPQSKYATLHKYHFNLNKYILQIGQI